VVEGKGRHADSVILDTGPYVTEEDADITISEMGDRARC
jgi:hypothetical protein